MVSKFEELRAKHNTLLKELEGTPDPAFYNSVQDFITQVQQGGREVYDPRERDQLRSFLRYWATILYEQDKSRGYKVLELEVYSGRPVSARSSTFRWLLISLVSGLILITALAGVLSGVIPMLFPARTATLSSMAQSTTANPGPTQTPLMTSSPTPLPTLTSTATPIPQSPSPLPSASASPEQAFPGPFFILTSPRNGASVSPQITFTGQYKNLNPGWSIHILVQPLSKGGRYFPLPQFFSVPANPPDDQWSISGDLGEISDVSKADSYIIYLAVANTEELRKQFISAVRTGFDRLPEAAIVASGNPVTIQRRAYKPLKGPKLAYYSYLNRETAADIFISSPDGSDAVRITDGLNRTDLDPSISPSGEQIAYVVRYKLNEKYIFSLRMMDSNGENPRILSRMPDAIYEGPVFSPDGRYLVYSVGFPDPKGGSRAIFNLWLYDLIANQEAQLTQGEPSSRYPTWMPDSKTIIYSTLIQASGSTGLVKLDIEKPKEKPRLVYDSEMQEVQPDISRDGKWIVYAANNGQDFINNIYLLNLDTMKVKRLTDKTFEQDFPRWSPDGLEIYYNSYQSGHSQIWAISRDGKNVRQITFGTITDCKPYLGILDTYIPLP